MKNRLLLLLLISIVLSDFVLLSFAEDIKIHRVLNTGKVNICITQDKDGLFWIGTQGGGLLSYDGNDVKKVNVLEGKSLFLMTPSVFVDSKGVIWVFVQSQGLFSCDKNDGIWKNYRSDKNNLHSLTSNNVYWPATLIAEDKDGLIWIGTANGLNSYNKNTDQFTQYKNIPNNTNSLSDNSVRAVFVDHDGLIWIGTENGLNTYDKKTKIFNHYKHISNEPDSLSDDSIYTINECKNGLIWIGTEDGGICSYNKQTKRFTTYKHDPKNPNTLSFNGIRHIMVDHLDNLWICNLGGTGIDKYDPKTNTFKNYKYDPRNINSISSNQVLSSFEDSTGIIWLVDSSGGVNKCTEKKDIFKIYSYNPENPFSITADSLARLYEDKNKNVWIGTFKGGMCLYTPDDRFEKFIHTCDNSFSLPSNTVYSIIDAPDNKLWVGNMGDVISLLDPKTKRVLKTFKDPYSMDTPCNLIMDSQNPDVLWFASYFTGGIFKLNTITGEFFQYKHNPEDACSVSNQNTFDILQDGNTLWLGTGGHGLTKFDKTTGKCIHYKHDPSNKNSISGNLVLHSYIDSRGSFWVTTDDGGLNKFDKEKETFIHYRINCGFPSNSTKHILEDGDGYLWISTDSGIVKFDPNSSKVVRWFTVTDGLPSNEFEDICNAMKDSNGNLWFPTLKGLCKFNPYETSKTTPNPNIPIIILSSFKSKEGTCNESGIRKITNIKLPWPDNSFEFTFSALDYVNPKKNQYAYKLDGFDKTWNYVGTSRFGRYTNIPPGEYTLQLKGSNNDGVWNNEGISIKITITPPFWENFWFKGLLGGIILTIVAAIFQLKIRAIKKKAANMRYLAEITAQVAHDIRSPLAALNTALKDLRELPEPKRILIRNATRRISDIANNLLIKYKVKENQHINGNNEEGGIKAELISSLLEYLISEKRAQMVDKTIELTLEIENNAHSCFSNVEPENFKRVISNLINNAFEAIDIQGFIRVVLTKQDNDLIIEIIDNGKGIPEEILSKIRQGKEVSNKRGGCGLGISGAIQNIKRWNGSYDIKSKITEGTTFTIKMPITEEPDWFQNAITIFPNTSIIILDDDQSIHNIWQTHLNSCFKDNLAGLKHFYDSSALTEYCNTLRSDYDLFLIDYELANSKETGLDLIEQLNLKRQATLVTSRYEEEEIRKRIKELGIKIIPKNFAPYIPISLEIETVTTEQPDIILIDDDTTLTEAWKIHANLVNKKIATFNHSEDFKKVMTSYKKDVPIYIDSDLKEKIPGEIFAKFIHEQGFHNLYLTTGYEKNRFKSMAWIKDIVNKEPPF